MDPVTVIVSVVGGLVLGAVCTVLGSSLMGRSLTSTACREVAQLRSDAEREAATVVKDANTAAKEQRIELRAEIEKEARESRKELQAIERRIQSKEENVDKRLEKADKRVAELQATEQSLDEREAGLESERERLGNVIEQQTKRLEQISGLSAEEAKRQLFANLELEVKRDSALRLKRIEDEMVDNSDKKAQWLLANAVQRCAADFVAEHSVSVVNLPSDEMKGRIIGREGRNIRALEAATGINIIIDDTPEAVILSGFDPVRREVARRVLEKLVQDGRIHPGRIEEMVEKTQGDLDKIMKEAGEQACFDADVHGLHPEIVKLLGRLTYRTSYGQNVLRHSVEVSALAALLAAELGLDIQTARRAALIHDIGKALTHEIEGSHAIIGHDLVKKYGENDIVSNAVGAHHNEMPMNSTIAVIVQACDALSAARPGARRETVHTYLKRLEQLEEIAESYPGVEKCYALQAGREIRIVVEPGKVDDAQASQLARDVARKVESEMTYPGTIRVTVIRETRASETAM